MKRGRGLRLCMKEDLKTLGAGGVESVELIKNEGKKIRIQTFGKEGTKNT